MAIIRLFRSVISKRRLCPSPRGVKFIAKSIPQELSNLGLTTEKMSVPSKLMAIRPAGFKGNCETAESNVYQKSNTTLTNQEVQNTAKDEFDELVSTIQRFKIDITLFEDAPVPKPDAVFSNNWISFHKNRKIVLYPMCSKLRRQERRSDIVQAWVEQLNSEVVDYSHFELESKYLEGTGSLVLDRENWIAYACESPRTDPSVFKIFCQDFDYKPVLFEASDNDAPVYHTNVMMSIGRDFAVICDSSIKNSEERQFVLETLQQSGKRIISITAEQVSEFCGNMLPVYNKEGEACLLMSTRAFEGFTAEQIRDIEQSCRIVHSPVPTMEELGGGSVRCMLTEVFP